MNLFCPYFSFETQNWIFQEYKLHIIIYTFETCFKLLNYFSHSLLTRWHALFSLFQSSTIVLWIQKTTQEFSFLSSSLLFLVSKKKTVDFLSSLFFDSRLQMMMTWFDRFGWLLSLHNLLFSLFLLGTLNNNFYFFHKHFTSIAL